MVHRNRHTSEMVTCSAAEPVTPVTGHYVTAWTDYPGLEVQAWEPGGDAHIGRTPILGCIAVGRHCTAGCGCHRYGWALAPGCSSAVTLCDGIVAFWLSGAAPLPSGKCTGTPNFSRPPTPVGGWGPFQDPPAKTAGGPCLGRPSAVHAAQQPPPVQWRERAARAFLAGQRPPNTQR